MTLALNLLGLDIVPLPLTAPSCVAIVYFSVPRQMAGRCESIESTTMIIPLVIHKDFRTLTSRHWQIVLLLNAIRLQECLPYLLSPRPAERPYGQPPVDSESNPPRRLYASHSPEMTLHACRRSPQYFGFVRVSGIFTHP